MAKVSAFSWRRVRRKLAKWLFFELAFALLPLLLAAKERLLDGERVDLFAIVGRGELLLVAVAVIAAGVGELIANGMNQKLIAFRVSLVGIGVLVMVSAANFYGDLAGSKNGPTGWAADRAVEASLIIAGAAIILNLACIFMTEVQ